MNDAPKSPSLLDMAVGFKDIDLTGLRFPIPRFVFKTGSAKGELAEAVPARPPQVRFSARSFTFEQVDQGLEAVAETYAEDLADRLNDWRETVEAARLGVPFPVISHVLRRRAARGDKKAAEAVAILSNL